MSRLLSWQKPRINNMRTLLICLTVFIAFNTNAQSQKVNRCVIINGILQSIEMDYNNQTGDYTFMLNGSKVNYKTFWKNSKDYAASASWYINNETVQISGSKYVKYGLPRVLGAGEVTKLTDYKGVGVYAEPNSPETPEVIYIPANAMCEFQPYQREVVDCGTVVIKPSATTVKTGQNVTFTVTVQDAKEKFNYDWYVDSDARSADHAIVGAKNMNKLNVSTKGLSEAMEVGVYITGKNCKASKYVNIKITK